MLKEHYDYIIVGCGIYGITVARALSDKKYTCLIIDKRNEIGGNCHTTAKYGSNGLKYDIHDYGPHIFHTSDNKVIDFVTTYSYFNRFQLNILAEDENGKRFHIPFNMNTFMAIFGVNTPNNVMNIINKEIEEYKVSNEECCTLESKAISMVGVTLYNKLIKNYTEKQWGCKCSELSPDIIERLPVRFTFNNDYFEDVFEGIPSHGYTEMFENMINGIDKDGNQIANKIDIELGVDFLDDKEKWLNICDKVIYCGSVDELLEYKLGILPWRSLNFTQTISEYNKYTSQCCPIVNYVSSKEKTPFTRSVSHLHFAENDVIYNYKGDYVITYEYPIEWQIGKERYYPINNGESNELYEEYVKQLKVIYPQIELGGRIGLYKYFDMDDAISEAFSYANHIQPKKVYDYERFNRISNFCKVWVIGTNEQDVKGLNNDLIYNVFITNKDYKLHNINNLNRILCEYVAFYYVWKNNIKSDYIGFCHYRRLINIDAYNIIDVKRNNAVQYFFYHERPNKLTTHDDWDFIRDKFNDFAAPEFMLNDVIEYMTHQTTIPLKKIKEYCSSNKFRFANREIFFTNWDNFCHIMKFLEGYIEFVKDKYNLMTLEDWKKHISEKIISHYKKRYENLSHKIFTEHLVYQEEKDYLSIYNEDEGFGVYCNCWRTYAYVLELLVSVAIMTMPHMKKGNTE